MKLKCDACGNKTAIDSLMATQGKCPICRATIVLPAACAQEPERRFWRLFSESPWCIKVEAFLLSLITVFCVVSPLVHMMTTTNQYDVAYAFGGLFGSCIPLALFIWILTAIVRGKTMAGIWFWAIVSSLCFICGLCFAAFRDPSPSMLGVVVVPISLFAFYCWPLLLPSAWKWRRERAKELLAYQIAMDCDVPIPIAVPAAGDSSTKYKLKPVPILIFWIALIGLGIVIGVSEYTKEQELHAKKQAEIQTIKSWQAINEKFKKLNLDLKRYGIEDFLLRPANYTSATTDFKKTSLMFRHALDNVNQQLALVDEIYSLDLDTVPAKSCQDILKLNSIRKDVLKEWKSLCTLYIKICRHMPEAYGGDTNGVLKAEFATDDRELIEKKITAELEELDEQIRKVRTVATDGVAAATGLKVFKEMHEIQRQSALIEREYAEIGMTDFFARPADYLTATNDVEKTIAMLNRCLELSKQRLTLDDAQLKLDLSSITDAQLREKTLKGIKRSHEILQLEDQIFKLSRKIVGHMVEWHNGDKNGVLKAEFGVDTTEQIWQKIVSELEEFDKLTEKISEL